MIAPYIFLASFILSYLPEADWHVHSYVYVCVYVCINMYKRSQHHC